MALRVLYLRLPPSPSLPFVRASTSLVTGRSSAPFVQLATASRLKSTHHSPASPRSRPRGQEEEKEREERVDPYEIRSSDVSTFRQELRNDARAAKETVEDLGDMAKGLGRTVRDTLTGVAKKAKDTLTSRPHHHASPASSLGDTVSRAKETVKEGVEETVNTVKHKAHRAKETVHDTASEGVGEGVKEEARKAVRETMNAIEKDPHEAELEKNLEAASKAAAARE